MISCFAFEMLPDDLVRPPLEDVVLELVELGAHLAQHRERGVDAGVDDPVQQVAGALREGRLAHLLALAVALEHRRQRRQVLVRQRDQVVGTDEQVELRRQEAPGRLVEDREVENDEQVVVVGVELGALVAGRDVLDVQRVEPELALQPLAVLLEGLLEVQPADAGGRDDLVRARPRSARRSDGEVDGAARPQARARQQVRHVEGPRSAWRDANPAGTPRDAGSDRGRPAAGRVRPSRSAADGDHRRPEEEHDRRRRRTAPTGPPAAARPPPIAGPMIPAMYSGR